MENLKTSKLLKMISYILIPILVAIIGLSIFHLAFLNEYGSVKEKRYEKTEMFANDYLYFIVDQVSLCYQEKNNNNSYFMIVEDNNGNKYKYSNHNYGYSIHNGIGAYIDYIIIDKETNEIYTNIRINDYQKEIENIKDIGNFWNYIDGKIDTDINYINQDNIIYNSVYQYASSDGEGRYIINKNINGYDIYSRYNEDKVNQLTNFQLAKQIYNYALNNQQLPIYILPISSIALLVIVIYLLWAIGHEKGKDGISLNSIDNIPYEILLIFAFILITIFLTITIQFLNLANYILLILGIVFYIVCYLICAVVAVTTIKRIKARKFLKSLLIYSIFKWIKNKCKNIKEIIETKIDNKKIFWYYCGYVLISIILAGFFYTGFAIIALIVFWIWTYYKIKQYIKKQENIKEALKDIYNGKNNVHVNEEELQGILKEMAIYVNDISGGFSNAIQESLKSERLKTELITNVSHDIKTPLTSIINYVDLLKKENIENEKIKEYIDILDKKSQRLKKLTEDLVEASKASSGNVKLNIEEINIKELINQTIGEFKDKFEEKGLIIETTMPHEDLIIKADNRYVYRIIENLFSNITKYALENSRVYIDIEKNKESKVKISIKNISKDKLNISSDELMQRFVRGDKSRYTEGSGLGLSIAKSLTELQKGKFNVKIDGDLFRVDMEW